MISMNRPKTESRPYEFLLQHNIVKQLYSYENNNGRLRPPPDRGTFKIVSRLLIA